MPIVCMLPAIICSIFCDEEKTSWDLHGIVKAWVEPKYREVKRLVRPILEWLIWSCVNGRNKETSATGTYMSVVTPPPPPIENFESLAESAP